MSDPLNTPTMLLKNSLNITTPCAKSLAHQGRFIPRRLLDDTENNPPPNMISPSKFAVVRQLSAAGRFRLPLEDHDPNSQDSGISDDSKSCSEFRFAEPCGAAPRRMPSVDMSPRRLHASPLGSPMYGGTPDRCRSSGTPDTSPAARRARMPNPSPKRSLCFSTDSGVSLSSFTSESTDDGFLDLFQNDKLLDEDAQMPTSRLGNLLCAQILTHSTPPRSPQGCRPFQSSPSENVSPSKNEVFSLKRPLLLSSQNVDTTPVRKRHKPLSLSQESNIVGPGERGTLFQYGFKKTAVTAANSGLLSPPHSITPPPQSPPRTPSSLSECSIKLGFQRSATEELIGDFSRPFALPLLSAMEHDLKTISSDTLANLIKGQYSDKIDSYEIIDCRYPYEYNGGHIKGAVNLYGRDQITQELQNRQRSNIKYRSSRLATTRAASRTAPATTDSQSFSLNDVSREPSSENATPISPLKSLQENLSDIDESENDAERHVVIFHCEYSAERGPSLFRWLRQEDRARNPYPQLTCPELYLLDGGYKAFFGSHSDLCEPCSYTPMKHPEHEQDLKHFRAKSKSWAGKHHKKLSVRNLSRLGL